MPDTNYDHLYLARKLLCWRVMSFNTRIAYNILDGDTLINVDKSTINTANVWEHMRHAWMYAYRE